MTYADLDRVLDAAKAVAIPADQKILHAIPREYVLDDSQEGIRNPVGMTGVRLEVHAHLVVCAQSAAANISKCVQRCGLQVDDLILAPLASATAVLTADERELGVVLVDIGAGTTDLAVFVQGAICHTASLPIAGDHVTSDIAHMLRTPTPEAEQIKVRYACALAQLATAEESIQVPSVGDRPPRRLPRHALAQAVQGRYEEIFEMVQAELRRSGFEELVRAGMVLTGGAAKMEGVVELAEISGSDTFVHATTPWGELVAQVTGVHHLDLGSAVTLHLDPAHAYVFGTDGALLLAPARPGGR